MSAVSCAGPRHGLARPPYLTGRAPNDQLRIMLSRTEPIWRELQGGYRMPYDAPHLVGYGRLHIHVADDLQPRQGTKEGSRNGLNRSRSPW